MIFRFFCREGFSLDRIGSGENFCYLNGRSRCVPCLACINRRPCRVWNAEVGP